MKKTFIILFLFSFCAALSAQTLPYKGTGVQYFETEVDLYGSPVPSNAYDSEFAFVKNVPNCYYKYSQIPTIGWVKVCGANSEICELQDVVYTSSPSEDFTIFYQYDKDCVPNVIDTIFTTSGNGNAVNLGNSDLNQTDNSRFFYGQGSSSGSSLTFRDMSRFNVTNTNTINLEANDDLILKSFDRLTLQAESDRYFFQTGKMPAINTAADSMLAVLPSGQIVTKPVSSLPNNSNTVFQATAPDIRNTWIDATTVDGTGTVYQVKEYDPYTGQWVTKQYYDSVGSVFSYNKPIYLLSSGQSNMTPRNLGGDVTSDPYVSLFDPYAGQWVLANPQLDFLFPAGPADMNWTPLHFGKEARRNGYITKIVHHAQGSKSIDLWTNSADRPMWDSLTLYANGSGVEKFDVMIWLQGEADREQSFDYYRTELIDSLYYGQLRNEAWFDEKTIFVAGQLPALSEISGVRVDRQNAVIELLSHDSIVNMTYVQTKDLAMSTDGIHLVGEGYQQLGERFFHAYKSMPYHFFPNYTVDERQNYNIGVDKVGGMIQSEPAQKYTDFWQSPVTSIELNDLTVTGTLKSRSAIFHPNGKIYSIPFNAEYFVEFDPTYNTFKQVGDIISGSSKFTGAVLHPNGKIYCIPQNYPFVVVFDPYTEKWETIGVADVAIIKYSGGVLHPNGKVYAIPSNSKTKVLEINPSTNTVQEVGDIVSGVNKYVGGVIHPNGKIYGIPHRADFFLEYDPVGNTTVQVGNTFSAANDKFAGGVLHPNGKIYTVPFNAEQMLEFDPLTGVAVQVGPTFIPNDNYWGGIVHPNGKIYCMPYNATQVYSYDPSTGTGAFLNETFSGTQKFAGGALYPNGTIYGNPYQSQQYLSINPGLSEWKHEIIQLLSPYLNKF